MSLQYGVVAEAVIGALTREGFRDNMTGESLPWAVAVDG
jgi:hypothetical protein